MTPKQVKEIIENHQECWNKREKLEKQLINLAGRDFDQETWVLQRLEALEKTMDFVLFAVYGDAEVLTDREVFIVDHRMDGETLEQIAEFFSMTRESIRNALMRICKKIANAAAGQNVA